MSVPSWTDWVTAISTAGTAVAASAAGIAAWLGYRRDSRLWRPVIETKTEWRALSGENCIVSNVIVRNQLRETIVVKSARAIKPRGMTMTDTPVRNRNGGAGETVEINRSINPVGSNTGGSPLGQALGVQPTDLATFDFYLLPPPQWSAGRIAVEVRIEMRSVATRAKRMVIKRRITAVNNTHTDANAKKPD
jgi:hypothetical protein